MQLPPGTVLGRGGWSRVSPRPRIPPALLHAARRWHAPGSRFVLVVTVRTQRVDLFLASPGARRAEDFLFLRSYVASTSRFGIGQINGSNQTPLGLHRVARKVGGGWPVGTVFRARQVVGCTWQGQPQAPIAHRILWLEGLEPGLNRGGQVDTFQRYIYIHGLGDEPTLGRPASHGCIHLAAADLLPLYDRLPVGTRVWIQP